MQNGSGSDFFWGISYEDPLFRRMHHFLILEAGYERMSGDFSSAGENNPIPVLLNGAQHDTAYIVGVALRAELSYAFVNVGYKFNFKADSIPRGLGIQLCFQVGVRQTATFTKTVSTRFTDPDTTETAISVIGLSEASSLRLSLRPELTYDIPIANNRLVLTPFVGFDLPFTQVDIDENWTASSLFSGVALRYAFWQRPNPG